MTTGEVNPEHLYPQYTWCCDCRSCEWISFSFNGGDDCAVDLARSSRSFGTRLLLAVVEAVWKPTGVTASHQPHYFRYRCRSRCLSDWSLRNIVDTSFDRYWYLFRVLR